MELLKLRRYLNQEIKELGQKIEKAENLVNKYNCQIKEIEDQIGRIEEDFDFAYEAFSPISKEYGKTKDKIGVLNDERDEILKKQQELKEELSLSIEKRRELCVLLGEVDTAESMDCDQTQKIEEEGNSVGIRIVEEQERERQRIARELHDTIVQNITAMIYRLEFCQQVMDADPIRAKLEMQLIVNTIRGCVDDMREVVYNLRPMSFDDIGFEETLIHAVKKLQENTDMKIDFSVEGTAERLSPAYELTILRIIQEATSNSKKYSQSEKLQIILSYQESQIELRIIDKGNGFIVGEIKSEQQNTGFGISMMKERVHLLNGQIDIRSEKDEGTEIVVILPKKELKKTDEN